MAKSKLESYENLITALVDRYLSVDSLAFACSMDCVAVSKHLDFLMKNGLVQLKLCSNKSLYALTKRGVTIQRTLAITKKLDELKTTCRTMDEAFVSISGLPIKKQKQLERT